MVVRAILDTGASLNIITNRVVQFLGLDCAPQNVVIAGAYGDLVSKRSTTMQLTSMHEVDDTDYLEATCHVVHQLVSAPHYPEAVAVRKDPWTKRLQPLADSSFGKGGSVDLLLGSKDFSEASVEQISKHPTGTFTALNTIFGWVVFGGTTSPTNSAVALRADVKPSLDTLLSKLWEREEVPEIRASIHYQDHYQRLSDGPYSVSLPRKEHCPTLGASRPTALKRLLSTERFHQRRGKLESFQEALLEYSTLGHAEEVPSE